MKIANKLSIEVGKQTKKYGKNFTVIYVGNKEYNEIIEIFNENIMWHHFYSPGCSVARGFGFIKIEHENEITINFCGLEIKHLEDVESIILCGGNTKAKDHLFMDTEIQLATIKDYKKWNLNYYGKEESLINFFAFLAENNLLDMKKIYEKYGENNRWTINL